MEEQIRQIILKCLNLTKPYENKFLNNQLSEWDSIKHMQIIIEIEDLFDIEIDDELAATLDSHASIVHYVKQIKKNF